jgi:hypothetical protein
MCGGRPGQAEQAARTAPESLPARGAPAQTRGGRERLTAALAEHRNIRAAARAMGVGESTLRGSLKRHGFEVPTRRGRKARAVTAA